MLLFLHPFVPHLTEDLWQKFGNKEYLSSGVNFPIYNPKLKVESDINFVVQINGKFKFIIPLVKGLSNDEIKEKILSDKRMISIIKGKTVIKTIIIPNKLINLVLK